MKQNRAKPDPRIIRTRNLLKHALIELVPEKGFECLTVQDITDRATLNRATFYLHYKDKHELLLDAFDSLISDVTPVPHNLKTVSPEYTHQILLSVFNHIAEYSDFYCKMLGKEGDPLFITRVREYVMMVALNWFEYLQPDKTKTLVPLEIITNFLASAYLGTILWWLENGMKQSGEYMASQLVCMTLNSMRHLLGLDEDPDFDGGLLDDS